MEIALLSVGNSAMILKTRIIAATILVLLFSVALSTAVTLKVQENKILGAKVKDMEVLSDIISRSIEDAMSRGEIGQVQKILENIAKSDEIINLRVVSEEGFILKSNKPGEIGLKSAGYEERKAIGQNPMPLVVKDGAITHLAPIRNRKQCFGCHNRGKDSNGVIEMKYDFTRGRSDMLAIRKFLIISNVFTIVTVAGILSLLFSRVITDPLRRLLDTIKQVEDGNWQARVSIEGSDELGSIGKSFNRMLREIRNLYDKSLRKEKEISRVKAELDHKRALEELNTQLQYKVKEVETANKAVLSLSKEVKAKNRELEKMVERLKKINAVGGRLTTIIEIEELLKLIIRTTAEMLNVERGFIHMTKNGESHLTLQYQRGMGIVDRAAHTMEQHPVYQELLRDGKPVLTGVKRALQDVADPAAKPAIGVPLKMKGQIIGGMLFEDRLDGGCFTGDEVEILETMANHAIVAIENAWLYETVKNNYFGTVQSLINALEANDKYTRGHSERVRFMSLELGRFIGLDNRELEILEHAAILHDIGKIGIDSALLNKPGRLTNAEFSLIKTHPVISDEILGPIGTLEGVRTTVLQHHERYDGKGYPYGIAGEEILLKARVLAVIDAFDAMLAARPYRNALPFSKAVEEIKACAGTQFDPFIVKAFVELIETNPDVLMQSGYSLN